MKQKTLLDEFAIAALPVLLEEQGYITQNRETAYKISQATYEIAKAMMQEREKYVNQPTTAPRGMSEIKANMKASPQLNN